MIVRDFSWENFNRSQNVSSYYVSFISALNSIKVYPFIAKFHKDFIDIKFLCWLGVETNEISYFIADWYLKINAWFVGTQSTSFHEYDSKLIDITGRVLFDDEIFLFDMETHLIRESMSSLSIKDDIDMTFHLLKVLVHLLMSLFLVYLLIQLLLNDILMKN